MPQKNEQTHGKCYKYLVKDFGSLQILFIVLCGLVLLEELYVFFFEKPTLTTVIKSEYSEVPDILICPQPAVYVETLKSLGYPEYLQYFVGTGKLSALTCETTH